MWEVAADLFAETIKTTIIVFFATVLHVGMAEKAAHENNLVMVRLEQGQH